MKTFLPAALYNYYPQTAISLCVTSYLDVSYIPSQVRAMGLEVVWGPARLLSFFDVPYSVMYVARNATTNEHWVVVRGTDPVSLTSWITEDFKVGATEAFTKFVPHAPADARISLGTANGLTDLLELRDPNTGTHVREFLEQQSISYLYVTGHSLGGTLTPPLFATLAATLHGEKLPDNMAMWSFAGLTSGDKHFAAHIDSLTQGAFQWRFVNPYDVAPLLFSNEEGVKTIYDGHDLPWHSLDFILRGLLDDLFDRAKGKEYTQPQGEHRLTQTFNPEEEKWSGQASYQHHGTTYQQLVYAQFPVKFPLGQ